MNNKNEKDIIYFNGINSFTTYIYNINENAI